MYPAMGVALYHWGVIANLARMCGISFNRGRPKKCVQLLLLSCAKSHMLSASRRQPRLLHVSAVDRCQTWSMDKS